MTKDKTTPPAWQNERATGARKLEPRPDLQNPDIIHTGDPDDEPRRPYGLTEPPDGGNHKKVDAERSVKRVGQPLAEGRETRLTTGTDRRPRRLPST